MCSQWQEYGLWALVGAAYLAGLATGTPVGWICHSVRQWWRRTMVHVSAIKKSARPVLKVAGVLLVVSFVAYAWLLA